MEPSVRAALVSAAWRRLDEELPVVAAALGGRPAGLADTSAFDWQPAHLLLAVHEGILEHAGEDALARFSRHYVGEIVYGPVLEPILKAAFKFFGRHPSGLYRWTPQVWSLCTRTLGSVQHSEALNGCQLVFLDLPGPFSTSQAWRLTVASGLQGLLGVLGRTGAVNVSRSGGDLAFDVQWAAGRAATPAS